jgi:hypothetical protein
MNDFVLGTGFLPNLYVVDLNTGAATLVGAVGITTDQRVSGMSVALAAPPGGGGGPNVPLPAGALLGPVSAALAMKYAKRLRSARR